MNIDTFDNDEPCQRCRSKEHETVRTFGGYWRVVCSKCGNTISSGRETMEGVAE